MRKKRSILLLFIYFIYLLYWPVLPVFHVPVHVGFEDVIGDRISFQGRKVKIVVFKIFICDKLLGIWLYIISVLKDTSEQQPDDIRRQSVLQNY